MGFQGDGDQEDSLRGDDIDGTAARKPKQGVSDIRKHSIGEYFSLAAFHMIAEGPDMVDCSSLAVDKKEWYNASATPGNPAEPLVPPSPAARQHG